MNERTIAASLLFNHRFKEVLGHAQLRFHGFLVSSGPHGSFNSKLPIPRKSRYHSSVNTIRKREFQVYNNFAAADEADYAYYRSLTGNQKLKLMLEIMAPAYEANPRFERVYRVIERPLR
jgi:hypothetical protein